MVISPAKYLAQSSPRTLAVFYFVLVFGGTGLAFSMYYKQAIASMRETAIVHMDDLARMAAYQVDLVRHENLVSSDQVDSPEYRQALAPLVRFHLEHPSIVYVYTVRVAADGREYFILDTTRDESVRRLHAARGRKVRASALLDEYRTPAMAAEAREDLSQGRPHVFPRAYKDEFGIFATAWAPLLDASGRYIGYAGVDYELTSFERRARELRWYMMITMTAALGVALLLAAAARQVHRHRVDLLAEAVAARRAEHEQRERADQANQAKSELLAIASHDLKNPLTAIAGMSGLLLQVKRSQPDQAAVRADIEVLETIHASSRHMGDLVRGILQNEGLEHGGMGFHPAKADLVTIAREILQFNAFAFSKKQIAIRTEMPDRLEAQVDAKLMREAFDNYISNALKYSPPGGVVTVALRRLEATREVEFSVQDTGPGLSPEDQAKLFQRFMKLKPRPTGGESSTGLGLSIVKTIAEMHQGKVGCESIVGQGARFWLRLPAGEIAAGVA